MRGYIKIENKGEIDVEALTLLGATNKRGDNSKIGYFGSGLKYAIAVLIKQGIGFKIFSGEKEIKVTTLKKDFRGSSFDVIKVNGKQTSLTTDMGPTWEPWFAVREIYCNAIDEGEHKMGLAGEPKGEIGKTLIFIEFDEKLTELFDNWNKYFSDKRKDILINEPQVGFKLFSGNSEQLIIYRKGVRCYEENRKALFHYDLGFIKVDESRVLANPWGLKYDLPEYLGKYATKDVIQELFDNYQNSFEDDLEWSYAHKFNDIWLEVLAGRDIVVDLVSGYFQEQLATGNCIILSRSLSKALKNYFGNKVNVLGESDKYDSGIKVDLTEKQKLYIQDSLDFLKKAGINIDYPIVGYHFSMESVVGEGRNGEIRISPKVFNKGKREIVKTLLEEYSHLESGASDKTRAFQDYLFNNMVGLLEEKVGERL